MFKLANFFQNLLSNRIKNENKIYIHLQGSSYFAVKNLKIEEIIKILRVNITSIVDCNEAFSYLSNKENDSNSKNEVKIILSEFSNDWTFIYWSCGYFEECTKLIIKLLLNEKIIANYYYADQYVDGLEWIISEKGKIVRQFEYQMGEIFVDLGEKITQLESKFIETVNTNSDGFIFQEDVFTSILEKTCEIRNEPYSQVTKFRIGTIHI